MIRSSYDYAVSAPTVSETTQTGTSLVRGRLLVFAAIVLSALTLRAAVTSISPLFGRIATDLQFGDAVIGVVGMLPPAMFAVFGLATPLLAKRTGLERAALLAMALTTIGMATGHSRRTRRRCWRCPRSPSPAWVSETSSFHLWSSGTSRIDSQWSAPSTSVHSRSAP